MTPRQFATALSTTRMPPDSRAAQAARQVLVGGLSRSAAARDVGVDVRAVSRAVARLQPTQKCPQCGGTGKLANWDKSIIPGNDAGVTKGEVMR